MGQSRFIAIGLLCGSLGVVGSITSANAATDKNIESCKSYNKAQNYDAAIKSGKLAIKSSPKQYDSHYCLGDAYFNKSEYKLAIPELKRAESLAISKVDLADSINLLAMAYENTGEVDLGFKYANNYLNLCRELDNSTKTASALNNVASYFMGRNELDRALEYYQEALNTEPDELEKGSFYGNIAVIYSKKGQFDNTESYLKKAIDVFEKKGDFHRYTRHLIKMGDLQYRKKDYKSAEVTLLDGLKKIVSVGDAEWEAIALRRLGWVNEATGNKPVAANYYNKALAIFSRIGATDQVKSVKQDLAELGV